MNDHPVRLLVSDDLRRSRLTVLFRGLLLLPHAIFLGLWTLVVLPVSVVNWLLTLVVGRLPRPLHRFSAAYVRYHTHVLAYLHLAANPWPGKSVYPIDLEIDEPRPQRRWTTLIRGLLIYPALFVALTLVGFTLLGAGPTYLVPLILLVGGVAGICGFLAWFVSLVRGRTSPGLRNLAAYATGYSAQVWAYGLVITDRYPNSDPGAIGPRWELPPHPVELRLDDDRRRSRLTVFFRLLLALPHVVWITLWAIAAFVAAFVNWVVALFSGRSWRPLHRFLSAFVRYQAHVTAFIFLIANPFPGFVGAAGYPLDVTLPEIEPQNRWVTGFRHVLVIPAALVLSALSYAFYAVGFLGWFAALVTGRMPEGMRNLGAFTIRYTAQTYAYAAVLTDRYPFASPALRPPPEPEPEPQPEPEREPEPEPYVWPDADAR